MKLVTMLRVFVLVTIAVVGVALPATATDSNQVDFWCDDGMKVEPVSTPYVVPAPPAGATWTLLVLKAGTENQTIANPVVGQAYSHTNGKDISHVILCYEEEVPPSTTTTSTSIPTTTTTGPPDTTTTTGPPRSTTTTTVVITTTTTQPPTSTTTTTDPESSTSTTVPPTTSTTEVPPPTLIESGDAGYLDEVEEGEEHEDAGFAWGLFALLVVAGSGGAYLGYLTIRKSRD